MDAIRNQSLKMMERLNEWRWRRREASAEDADEVEPIDLPEDVRLQLEKLGYLR